MESNDDIRWLPMTCDGKEMMSGEEVARLLKCQNKKINKCDLLGLELELGKYDINFSINILRTILIQIQSYKMSCEPLYRTLDHSLRRMLAMLEVERDQIHLKNQ